MKRFLLFTFLLTLLNSFSADACTAVIVSGRCTPDGRPIMWKNRDTSNLNNCVRYLKGEKYDCIAIVSYVADPKSVWTGTNDAGFSIMNTLSYNLNDLDKNGQRKVGNKNGSFMRRALEICADVNDFRNFLDTTAHPIPVEANYGVIDANGGASFFEVGNNGYTEYDVNDTKVAPFGYLVKTNFSFSGRENDGGGFVRFQEAERKMFNAAGAKVITPEWLFTELSRSFENPLLGIDLRSGDYNKPKTNGWFIDKDFIARRSTSCAAAIQGVKKGEKPEFTCMWTIIGYPPVTPAIPLWVKGAEGKIPEIVAKEAAKGGKYRSPLCDTGNDLRKLVYSYNHGNLTDDYFNWELLYNPENDGLMQKTERTEADLFKNLYNPRVAELRKGDSLNVKEVHKLYEDAEAAIVASYADNFNINL